MIKDEDIEAYELAAATPAFISPCDTTVWYIGDKITISWQGGAIYDVSRAGYLTDSTQISYPVPSWRGRLELYRYWDFLETLMPSDVDLWDVFPVSHLTILRPDGYIFITSHAEFYIEEQLYDLTPGDGYQLRWVIIDDILLGDFDHPKEACDSTVIWSEPFSVSEPWLEITLPDSSTVWREDSADVHIEYVRHGTFGLEYPDRLSPSIYLVRDDSVLWSSGDRFSDGICNCYMAVSPAWGCGDNYQIFLEMSDGQSFQSDTFSILGQTLLVSVNADSSSAYWPTWSIDDHILRIEWQPATHRPVSVELYRENRGSLSLVKDLVIYASDSGFVECDVPEDIEWEEGNYRIKVENSEGEYGWSDTFWIDLTPFPTMY